MKKKPSKITKVFSVILILLFLTGGFFAVQHLLVPKYCEELPEGGMVREYYKEPRKDFDVLFIGDCEVYENFSPMVLWENYGISSYIRGSSEQYISQSYYMLEDTLRYEKPKVLVFNARSLRYGESWSEPYNRMTMEGMRWSETKVNCIRASMLEEENFIDYVFPILRYHTRWKEIGEEDFKYYFKTKPVSHNGYYMVTSVKPVDTLPSVKPLPVYDFPETAMEYMDKIRLLCEENDIELLLIKAPSLYPHWYDEWDAQAREYARKYNLVYVNFLEHESEIGIDWQTDTPDGGMHMNLSGAEKSADYLGKILRENYNLPDRRNEADLCAYWEQKRVLYDAQIEADTAAE